MAYLSSRKGCSIALQRPGNLPVTGAHRYLGSVAAMLVAAEYAEEAGNCRRARGREAVDILTRSVIVLAA